ncbi:hypothetical protein F5Y04DRAFT_266179 [Hypomontagnella monticulosa]|nr:hypothetical protein F5Y04DRAFT_266179 [Hypomontagnella monticulosa]
MGTPWQTILVYVFVSFGVLVVVVLCARWSGWCRNLRQRLTRNQRRPKRSLPKSIQHALTELGGVTELRACRNTQTESEDAECPICLSYLYPKDVRSSTSIASNQTDLEAGSAIARTITTTTTTTDAVAEEKRQSMQPIDDEVLMMKRCPHLFHSRCLATWFLRKKYDCPVCRTPYYQVVEDMVPNEDYRIPPTLPVVAFW